MNLHHPQSRKQLIILGVVSLVVLAGAGVLGGFLAGALAASRNDQPYASLETIQDIPPTQTTPVETATEVTVPTPIRPTSTP